MPKVKIELTKKEALEILSCAGNGYGDGDFYDWRRKDEKYFVRAYEKIAIALKLKNTKP